MKHNEKKYELKCYKILVKQIVHDLINKWIYITSCSNTKLKLCVTLIGYTIFVEQKFTYSTHTYKYIYLCLYEYLFFSIVVVFL